MGACTALHAARRCDPLREPVVLIEKERLGAGCSGSSAGIVFGQYSDRVMAGMARDALKVYSGFESNTGRSIGFRHSGVMIVAGPQNTEGIARIEADIEMQQAIGVKVERVMGEQLRELLPGADAPDGTVGAWGPDAGFIDPVKAIGAFAVLARDAGTVTRIGATNPEVLVEGGKAIGVRTDAGTFHAPNVVLATGAWTPSILAGLGVQLPLEVGQSDQHYFRMPSSGILDESDDPGSGGVGAAFSELETHFTPSPLERRATPHPVVFDLDHGVYIRCEPAHDRTRVGRMGLQASRLLNSPADLDRGLASSFTDDVSESLNARFPIYGDLAHVESQAVLVTRTPDLRPVVGPVSGVEGLFVAAGFHGNDFQLAPSIGEGLAQLVLGQPVSAFNPEFFSPERFAEA